VDTSKGQKFITVPDEIKAKAMADLQGLPQLAADAQQKMPKLFMVAVERATNPSINAAATDDANSLLNVIQFVCYLLIDPGPWLISSTRQFRSSLVKRLKTNTWLHHLI
jgi:hypothetical protein